MSFLQKLAGQVIEGAVETALNEIGKRTMAQNQAETVKQLQGRVEQVERTLHEKKQEIEQIKAGWDADVQEIERLREMLGNGGEEVEETEEVDEDEDATTK